MEKKVIYNTMDNNRQEGYVQNSRHQWKKGLFMYKCTRNQENVEIFAKVRSSRNYQHRVPW